MKEIQGLLARAATCLRSARLLASVRDFESAVSRAYYAMFDAPEAALLDQGITASSHKGVIAEFNRVFLKAGVVSPELGRSLGLAFEKRQLGDYEFTPVITQKETEEIPTLAEQFVTSMGRLLSQRGQQGPEIRAPG